MSLTAAASTMLRTTNFLMALSLGTHLAQFVHRTDLVCPRPRLDLPLLRRLLVYKWEFSIKFGSTQQCETETCNGILPPSHIHSMPTVYKFRKIDITIKLDLRFDKLMSNWEKKFLPSSRYIDVRNGDWTDLNTDGILTRTGRSLFNVGSFSDYFLAKSLIKRSQTVSYD